MIVCGVCGQACNLVDGYEEFSYEYGSINGVQKVRVSITSCCRNDDWTEVEDDVEPEESELVGNQ